MFETILQLIASILTLKVLLLLVAGVFVGASFGAIPGLSGILAIALFLPFTYYMAPVPALALLIGAYKGAMFGGSVSAISFGVPGDSPAAATVLDGYPLAKKGKPYKALSAALYSSVSGDFASDIVVVLTLMPLSYLALKFGPRELAALMILAMLSLVLLLGRNLWKGLVGVALGGLAATFGFDPITSVPRLTFGLPKLMDGFPLVPFVVGIFAFSEILIQFGQGVLRSRAEQSTNTVSAMIRKRSPEDRLSAREFFSCWRELIVGFTIGVILGVIPGPGATMSAFTSYGVAGRLRKNRGKLGTGKVEGIVAAESGNSSTVGPTLIPLLTFGVPGSGIAALFGAALILQGLTPGPGLFTDHVDLLYSVMILLLLGNLFNLAVCKLVIIPVFTRLSLIEPRLLVAWLTPLMMIGIYSINLRAFDVVVLFAAGVLGLILRRIRVPLAPIAVAFMVAPMLEVQLSRTLILSHGSLAYWFASPLTIGLYLTILALAVYAWLTRERRMQRGQRLR